MHLTEQLANPGEHALELLGLVGPLEAVLTVPAAAKPDYFAILGHPHSLQGGTMNNKVVTTLARAFKELGIPSLRFNFRGVGKSAGTYDDGIGESEDMLLLARQWQEEQKQVKFIFAGFSFGSFVAYRCAAQIEHSLLITVAPPVHHYDYKAFNLPPFPWAIMQGNADEVVPVDEVVEFAAQCNPSIPLIEFDQTGHFFHGKLLDLKEKVLEFTRSKVGL